MSQTPQYYKLTPTQDVFDLMDQWANVQNSAGEIRGYYRWTAATYVLRAGLKGDIEPDIAKAIATLQAWKGFEESRSA